MKRNVLLSATVLTSLLLSTTASAYLDPSVATYLIQAVAGVVITIGTVVGLHFHKIKNKVNDTLGIDENAKKEIEEDLMIYDEEKK